MTWIHLLAKTTQEFLEDKAFTYAGALAFYTLFSLAPFVMIAIALTSLLLGESAAQTRLIEDAYEFLGKDGGQTVSRIIQNTTQPTTSWTAAIIGLTVSLFGATAVFAQLQDSLNAVWRVRPKASNHIRSLWTFLRIRLLSFLVILGLGMLLIGYSILGALVFFIEEWTGLFLPTGTLSSLFNFLLFFLTVTLAFAMMFKILPDVIMEWRDVWFGALVSAFLFVLGKELIDYYLSTSTLRSVYGAAGSLALILVWIYYSSLIFLFGAEFTAVYSRLRGRHILPKAQAERIRIVKDPVPIDEKLV